MKKEELSKWLDAFHNAWCDYAKQRNINYNTGIIQEKWQAYKEIMELIEKSGGIPKKIDWRMGIFKE